MNRLGDQRNMRFDRFVFWWLHIAFALFSLE